MNRLQIRRRVQDLLRDDTFPSETINEAIARVIAECNNLGRMKFHENSEDVTLVDGTYAYTTTSTIIAEHVVVFAPGSSTKQKIVEKGSGLIDAFGNDAFLDSADSPDVYYRWGGQWLFDPKPNSTAAADVVRIYHFKDLTLPSGDFDTISLPARYHDTVLVYGTCSMIRPGFALEDGRKIADAYKEAKLDMVRQEKWEPNISYEIIRDRRFVNMTDWGNRSQVRG